MRGFHAAPVKPVPLDNFTYGGSRNVGLAASRGEYVAFLSAHAELLLDDDWLGEMRRACAEPEPESVPVP